MSTLSDVGDGCVLSGTRLVCDQVPTMIPRTVQKVFLKNINIENDSMRFDTQDWRNIRVLDIHSEIGKYFKDRHQPLFNALPNLKILGIHALKLLWLDKEALQGLPKLKTLDFYNSVRLNVDEVTKLFSINSSLSNVENINLGFVNTVRRLSPTALNKVFFELLRQRKIKTLNLHGMEFQIIDFKNMRKLCQSLEVLNISNVVYIFHTGDTLLDLAPCRTLKILDMSEWKVRFLALHYLRHHFENTLTEEFPFEVNLTGFSSLHTIYADSLDFGVSEFEIKVNGGYLTCTSCLNTDHAKNVYLRDNRLKWLNVSCDITCENLKLELIDLSSNGLEYISPGLLKHIVTLEDINLHDNSLYVMEEFAEFNSLFATLSKLRKVTLSANGFNTLPQNIFDRNMHLQFIDVANNKLSVVPRAFSKLAELKWLDFSKNALHILAGDNFVHFSFFIEKKLNELGSDFSLKLSGNLFTCNCEGTQLIKWLFVYLIPQIHPDPALQCLLDGVVVNIDNTAVLKSQHSCDRKSVVVVSAILSVSLIVVSVCIAVFLRSFLRRKRRNRRRQEFIDKFKNDKDNLVYLAFLIYCSKNEKLIADVILPYLSQALQVIFEADEKLIGAGFNEFRLGQTIFSEMERCIRQSAVAIYVHNQNSAECARCKRELKMACEKDKPIAVILNENVEDALVSPLLDMVINKSLNLSLVKCRNHFEFKQTANEACMSILDLAANI